MSSRGLIDRAVRAALAEGLGLPDLKTLVGDVAVEVALEESEGSARRAAALLGVTERAVQLRRKAPRPRQPLPESDSGVPCLGFELGRELAEELSHLQQLVLDVGTGGVRLLPRQAGNPHAIGVGVAYAVLHCIAEERGALPQLDAAGGLRDRHDPTCTTSLWGAQGALPVGPRWRLSAA